MIAKTVSVSLMGIVLFAMAWQKAPSAAPAKCCCEKSALDKYQQTLEVYKLEYDVYREYQKNNGGRFEPSSKSMISQMKRVRRALALWDRAEPLLEEEYQRQIKNEEKSSKEKKQSE